MKLRAYELARELEMPVKDLIDQARARGIAIRSNLSVLEPEQAEQLRKFFREPQAPAARLPAEAQRGKAGPQPAKAPAAVPSAAPRATKAALPAVASAKTDLPAGAASAKAGAAPQAPSPAAPPAAEPEPPAARTPSAALSILEAGPSSEREVRAQRPHEMDTLEMLREREEIERRKSRPTAKFPAVPPPASRHAPVPHVSAARRAIHQVPPPPPPLAIKEAPKKITVTLPITVKDLSRELGIKANVLLQKLLGHGVTVTINNPLGEDAVVLVGLEVGREIEIRKAKSFEEQLVRKVEDPPGSLLPRAPVVTLMGHVDHGKTSLLDRIRQSRVAESEHGGITQHIGAYRVSVRDKHVVFLDTPGHEAFTAMRARGANVTDVAVIVVAADDGVMPQTEEAINHARAAGVPIVVALNKIDKPDANMHRAKNQLSQLTLVPEEWGGKTGVVEVSALTGHGIEPLLERLVLEAEILELKANAERPGVGTVLEARMVEGRGSTVTVLVQNGTLRRGDTVLAGTVVGRVRALHDEHGRSVPSAGPATPVEVTGLPELPEAGDRLEAVGDLALARDAAAERRLVKMEKRAISRPHVTLETLFQRIGETKLKEVRIVLKTDVKGSAEVLSEQLRALSTQEVQLRILHCGVGAINESDILLADASDSLVLGFQVSREERAKALAEEKGVDVRLYNVIYEIIEQMRAALEGLLEPILKEAVIGHLSVKEVFRISRVGSVAGCLVTDGKILRSSLVRLRREGNVPFEGKLDSLKRFKDDVREVLEGYECGVKLQGFNDVRSGDILEVYEIQQIARKLSAPSGSPAR